MVLNSIINGNPEIESHILGIPNVNRGYQFNLRCWVTPLVALLSQPDDIRPVFSVLEGRRCPCCIGNSRMIIYFCSLPPGHSKLNSSFSLIFLAWSDVIITAITVPSLIQCLPPGKDFSHSKRYIDWLTDWSWVFRVTLLVCSKQQYPVSNVLKLLQNIPLLAGGPNTG